MGNAKGYLFIFPFLFLVSAAIANIVIDIAVPNFDPQKWRTATANLSVATDVPGDTTTIGNDTSAPGEPAHPEVSEVPPQDMKGSGSGQSGSVDASTVQQLRDDFSFYVFFTVVLALAIALLIIGFVRRSFAERFK